MLIGLDLVEEFIDSVIFTGHLREPHAPVSVLLIGSPESGKTSVVTQKKCKGLICVTDCTGRGLIELIKLSDKARHIVLNDMVAIMSHRQSVNHYLMAILNAVTEEGVQTMASPGGIEYFPDGKRGVIACLTMDLAKDGRSWWNKTGFSSRMLPFSFSHSGTLSIKIKTSIDASHVKQVPAGKKNKILRLPNSPLAVTIPEKYVRMIRQLADQKAKELGDPTGYRRLKQYRSLACGHALRRTWKKPSVTLADIEFLERISPYVSYTQCTSL